jgi:hypothetical protein
MELPRALLWQKLQDLRLTHLAILNERLDQKIHQASNSDVKKFLGENLKDIDHILAHLKDQ